MRTRPRRRMRLIVLGLAALTTLHAAGCVRRTMTINTDPQGAAVTLNDEQVGTSPVNVDFTWYGDYDVIIRHEGYETLKTNQKVDAPWYQVPPIDFITEILVPFEIHDQREYTFALEPSRPVDRQQLLQNAAEFRDRALYEGTPAATQPTP